jgi:HlyD family secretion protein
MASELMVDLADCTEYRQTLLARSPGTIRFLTILLSSLLASALIWAALTEADLVVRAPGSVRPVSPPQQVFIDFHGDVPGAVLGIAVVEVKYKQGDRVHQGDVLIRMDTTRLDSEISKRELTIRSGEKELWQLGERQELLDDEFDKAQAETRAELLQAEEDYRRAIGQRKVDIERAEAELRAAQQKRSRSETLVARGGAAPPEELDELIARARKAKSDLEGAQLEVVSKAEVFRRKLERQEKQYLGKRKELEREQLHIQQEVDLAKNERDKLVLERQQAVVVAPLDGVITSRELKVGDVPKPGEPVAEIAELNGFLFEVEVLNEDAGLLRGGLPARVKINAYDYQKYGTLNGSVCFIPPDSSVTQGRAVYLVRIELETDEVARGDYRGRIKFGMTGQAEIVTDQESLLSLLVRRIRQSISLG